MSSQEINGPLVPHVPASAAEVTADWLQRVLQPHFPEIEISQITSERIGESYGLASEIYRFSWESDRMPRSVVAKLWDTTGPGGRREVDFYRTFGPNLEPRVPACYHAAIDPENGRGILVLEDLGPFTQGDCLLQLTLSLTEAVARDLAHIHASYLEHPDLIQAAWLPSISTWDKDAEWYAQRRDKLFARYGDHLDRRARSLLDRFERAQDVANERLANASTTLVHGDFHLDNYVFLNGARPVLLDWARCARGPFVLDLYDLLFTMSDPDGRERVFAAYATAFAATYGSALDREEIWRQLGAAFLRSFALNTFGFANWQPNSPRGSAIIDVSLKRTLEAFDYWSDRDPSLFRFLE